jgi:hypothetical protein
MRPRARSTPGATRRSTRQLFAGALAALVVLAAGCSIQPDASPRDITIDDADSSNIDTALVAEAAGDTAIFLVGPTEPGQQRRLRSSQRGALASPTEVLTALFEGPTQSELDNRFISAIPPDTTLNSARRASNILYIDVSGSIGDLTDDALVLALGQIVFTASEIPGIQLVRLRVEGEDRTWPRGDGQSRIGDLKVYDFPGLAESTQPPFPATGTLT